MSELMFERDMESVEGAKYSLHFSPERLYHFSSKGTTPKELLGGFTGLRDALTQFDRYNSRIESSQVVKRVEIEDDCDLESLTTKVQLLSFADKFNIEVPSGLSNPKQIKKLLKAEVEA